MKIPLSPRLQACAEFVNKGDRIADIGCDHGYLTLSLLQSGIASSAIAADVNEMPLQSARLNAEKYGFSDRISFHLSDGVQNIPHEFDTMICAGMGADTIISILSAAPWLKDEKYRLILQCQSKTPMLRQYLSENGWYISEERVLRDGRFLYTVMNVYYAPDKSALSTAEYHFPPALLRTESEELAAYYSWVVEGLRIQAKHRNDPQLKDTLQNLEALSSTFKEEEICKP